jgi:hypothetical protein
MMTAFGQKSNWTPKDRTDFLTECVKAAKAGMSVDSARNYCYCMLEKIEVKYPLTEDAAKISEADLMSPDWQKQVRECLVSNWTSAQRESFLNDCIKEAKKGISEDKALTYCDCMLFKVERKYPSHAEAQKLTAEELAKPHWKKEIVGCLNNQ